MILRVLRDRTRDLHERVEGAVGVMDPDLDLDRYRALIARFYGFYAAIEARLAARGAASCLPFEFEERRKTPLLEADLIALGVPATDFGRLPKLQDPPRLETPYEMLGCCYVLEGATLGGRLISRHLRKTLGLGQRNGAAFFASYGERVGPMWRAFGEGLETFPGIEEHRDAAVHAARATFLGLERWLAPERSGEERVHG